MNTSEQSLKRVKDISPSKIFHNLLMYNFKGNLKELKPINTHTDTSLSNVVNSILEFTFNDETTDDYYVDKTKQKLADLLKTYPKEKLSIIFSLCNGLRVEKVLQLSKKDGEFNPLLCHITSFTRTIDRLIEKFFKTTYSEYINKQCFEDNISDIVLYKYIEDYNDLKYFGDNSDLYGSPFYILLFAIQLNNEDDSNENYITIPVLIFPFLKKLSTIMLSFSDKSSNCNDMQAIFISSPYEHIEIEKYINSIIIYSMELFFSHNPHYDNTCINGIYLDKHQLAFGNLFDNKICSYIRTNRASRHLLIKDDNYWIDDEDDLLTLYDQLKDSSFYNKITKNINKRENIDIAFLSWLDKMYKDKEFSIINSFFSELNSELGLFNIAMPLETYLNLSKSNWKM